MKYQIQFAPDGIHWQKVREGRIEKLWDDFCFNPDYKIHVKINPNARFRLVNLETKAIIGTLIGEYKNISVINQGFLPKEVSKCIKG